jgi:hypothetical protein
MKKIILSKKEKIAAVVILIWDFISFSNYFLSNNSYNNYQFFQGPWENVEDFLNFYFTKHKWIDGYDKSEIMVYVVLPWLIFFIYLFLLRKDNDQTPN